MDALVKNSSDKNQIRKARKLEKFQEHTAVEDMRLVLSTPAGRRVMWKYLEKCSIFSHGYDPDARYSTFREGQRNIGAMILEDINKVGPSIFGQMSEEMRINSLDSNEDTQQGE